MKWNIDFEVAALAFELVLIIFYFAKRHLPTNKNRYFILCMCAGCFMTFLDVVTAVADTYWTLFPIELLHVVNVLYFVSMALNVLILFLYVLTITGQRDTLNTPLFVIYCMPAVIAIILAIATPFVGAVYRFDPVEGYVHGPAYITNYVLSSFYLLIATVYVIVYRKNIIRLHLICLGVMLALLALGATLQSLIFNWVLLTNAFVCYSICILYMSLQNPDLYIDKETGLFNRDGFNEYLQELIDSNTKYMCLVICIDNYRTVKSVFGEEKARAALKEMIDYVIERYTANQIFRYDEETYIVLSPIEFDVDLAISQGRRRLEAGFVIHGEQIRLTARFIQMPYGGSEGDERHTNEIIDYALKRLDTSRGDIFVDEEFIRQSVRSRNVEIATERAIEKKTVQVYFMPIFSPYTEKMERAEALARIFDENVGFIPPVEFIAEAERNGSIIALGRQIFEKVCEFIKEQEPLQYGVSRISVNLSAMQLMQDGMAEEFIRIAENYNVSMSSFSFDIAEVSEKDPGSVALKNMNKLIDRGAEFALNDYGSGYSSLENIMNLPVKLVKIDRALVRSYFESGSMLLPDVIEMFRNQKLQLALVGVETKDMARRLSVMGCDYLQGYFYSRTIPARNFVALMKKQDGGDQQMRMSG